MIPLSNTQASSSLPFAHVFFSKESLVSLFYEEQLPKGIFSKEIEALLVEKQALFRPLLEALEEERKAWDRLIDQHGAQEVCRKLGLVFYELYLTFAEKVAQMHFAKMDLYVEDLLLRRGEITSFLGFPVCNRSILWEVKVSKKKKGDLPPEATLFARSLPIIKWGQAELDELVLKEKQKLISEYCHKKQVMEKRRQPLARNAFTHAREIQAVFYHLKNHTPKQKGKSLLGNKACAEWVTFALEYLYEYEVTHIKVKSTRVVKSLKNIFLTLHPPIDCSLEREEYHASVVTDANGKSYVFDLLLEAPLPLEDWKKGFSECAFVEGCMPFSKEHLREIFKGLRAQYLWELLGIRIDS